MLYRVQLIPLGFGFEGVSRIFHKLPEGFVTPHTKALLFS